jgi:hypothetical protein
MRRWVLAAGLAIGLAGCASPYRAALDSPPPSPGPGPSPSAGDLRAMAPYAAPPARPATP